MIDDLRARYPTLGFALYAYEPGGAVTLEVLDGADVYTFQEATEADVIAKAFPAPQIEADEPATPEPETPAPPVSVFD